MYVVSLFGTITSHFFVWGTESPQERKRGLTHCHFGNVEEHSLSRTHHQAHPSLAHVSYLDVVNKRDNLLEFDSERKQNI